jgi:hypothetical protein
MLADKKNLPDVLVALLIQGVILNLGQKDRHIQFFKGVKQC